MATKTKKHVSKLAAKPETIINNSPRIFTEADFPIGTVSHQGDVIFVRIAKLPQSAKTRADRQLAIGNTQGSRHVLTTGNVYEADHREIVKAIAAVCKGITVGDAYVGPVFQTTDGKAYVDHPEHGPQGFEGDMTIASVYQRSLDSEERERRVQD